MRKEDVEIEEAGRTVVGAERSKGEAHSLHVIFHILESIEPLH
jgi:hypothetical protein